MMRFAAFSPHGFEMVGVTGSEKKPNDAAEDDKYDVLGGDAPQFGPQQIHGPVSGSSSTFRKFWPGNVLNKIKICYHGRKKYQGNHIQVVIPRLLEIPPSHLEHSASFIRPKNEMYCDVLSDGTIFYRKI